MRPAGGADEVEAEEEAKDDPEAEFDNIPF
jgi:hypothetical protein